MTTAAKKTYFELVKEAILTLKDRTGSSAQAIKGFITEHNPKLDFQQVSQPVFLSIPNPHPLSFFP
jgi:hypothetical protein